MEKEEQSGLRTKDSDEEYILFFFPQQYEMIRVQYNALYFSLLTGRRTFLNSDPRIYCNQFIAIAD